MKNSFLLLLLFLAQSVVGQQKTPALAPRTDAQKLDYFLKLTDTLRTKAHNSGMAVVIIYKNQVLYKGGLGYRDVEKKLPVTNNTLFEIGSCTKAFTGVLASQLVADGKLKWDDKVVSHLPAFKLQDTYAAQNATVQDLLTHRVGLDKHFYLLYGPKFSRNEMLEKVQHLSFDGSFREKFLYNNLMYTVAGIVEEKAADTTWEQQVRQRIFEPLGMKNSFTTFEEFQKYPEKTISYKNDGTTRVPQEGLDACAPAGSITSTIDDMAKWLGMWLGKGSVQGQPFLSEKQYNFLTSPLTVRNPAEQVFYGIGWDVDTNRKIVYHDGRTGGQSSRILMMPQAGFGIVILTNQQTDLQNLLIRYATNIFVEDQYEKMPDFEGFVIANANKAQSKPEQKLYTIENKETLKKLATIAGVYTHPAYGTISITRENKNQLRFAYYDFKGTVKQTSDTGFTAFTEHFTGTDQFEFQVLTDAAAKVSGLEIKLPYSAPLTFTKTATSKAL
ncbi:serine hydrolase [Hymenobacter tenuis]